MKKTIFSWTSGILIVLLISAIRLLLGYKEPLAWYWLIILGIIALQIGKFLYYVLFGANIDNIAYLDINDEDAELQFSFEFNPYKMSQTEHGLASFDRYAYPELKDPKILQQILYGQTTKKEIRELTEKRYKPENQSIKTYKYRGKTYEVKFYS